MRVEAALDQRTMEICLAEIERCKRTRLKPNFIARLGDRYGWRPLPSRISEAEFERVLGRVGLVIDEVPESKHARCVHQPRGR